MPPTREDIEAFLDQNPSSILINVAATKGSTPREQGAWIIVSEHSILGTIGGGELEWQAIGQARDLISSVTPRDSKSVQLGPQIGQCCGGQVELIFTRFGQQEMAHLMKRVSQAIERQRDVYIFGAGHVGRAIAVALFPLPMNVVMIDQRIGELDQDQTGTAKVCTVLPEAIIDEASSGSAFLIATHDHGLDFLLADAALNRQDAAYIGMIGSKTKRNRFKASFLKQGGNPDQLENLICPMGASPSLNKEPEVIAANIAAELISTLL